MSTTVDNTQYGAFLKKYYIGKRALYQLDSYKTPLLGMIKKDQSAGGSTWEQTVGVTNVVGGAGTYTNAYANSSAGVDKVFSGNYKKRFADVKVDDFTIKSSRTGEGAVEKVLKRKVDGLKDEFMQTVNFQLFRDEGGSLAQLAACTGALVVYNGTAIATDSTKAGVQFIKPGKILNMGNALAGTGLESLVGTPLTMTVTGRNSQAGTFTYTAGSANAHPSGSAYVFEDGTATAAIAGLRSWVPLTDTLAATTFKSVDRSIDVNGLGGIRIPGVGESIEETLNDGIATSRQYGADPDVVIVHPKRYSQLCKELSGRLRWTEVKGKPLVGGSNSFSFKGLEIAGGGRPCVVLEDPACQTECSWILETDSLCLRSMGMFPFVPNEDGLMLHRIIGTANWQSELFAYCELLCAAPGHQTVISHDAGIA